MDTKVWVVGKFLGEEAHQITDPVRALSSLGQRLTRVLGNSRRTWTDLNQIVDQRLGATAVTICAIIC